VPDRRRVRQPALRLRAAASRSCRAHRERRRLPALPAAGGAGHRPYTKLDAYALQDTGLDTYEANLALGHGEDERSYLAAAQMLHALGVSRVALLSNNPDKARQLRRCGVTVASQVPTGVHLSAANGRYLATKAARGDHTLDLPLLGGEIAQC
jgi:GTP cyclohydrolase II